MAQQQLQYQQIKIKLRSFKSSEHINEQGDWQYHGFGYLSLFSDPIALATSSHIELLLLFFFKNLSIFLLMLSHCILLKV